MVAEAGLGLSEEQVGRLVSRRRHLHMHPELTFEELETAGFIEGELRAMGVEDIRRVSDDRGVVALIEGQGGAGPTLGFRADTDALSIEEDEGCPYRSRRPGVMHACGHDVHTAVGLGIAEALWARREELCGRVKMIFQPAEEASPGAEPVGAERMVLDGVLEDPAVEAMFAFHCMPTLEAGLIGYTGGPVWASSQAVEIEVFGEKSHGAYPHTGVDAVLVASQIVVALQSVVSRSVDARQACVLTIGRIEGGEAFNVVADRVKLVGLLRALHPEAADRAREAARRVVEQVAQAFGARAEARFVQGARAVINDVELEARMVGLLRQVAGQEAVVRHEPQMGAEDFASFSRRVPSCFLFLGVRNEAEGKVHMLHTPRFDVDERCLVVGVGAMSQALLGLARRWSER